MLSVMQLEMQFKSPVSLDTQVFMGIDPSSSMIIFNVSADTCVDACTQTPDANTDLNCASQLTAYVHDCLHSLRALSKQGTHTGRRWHRHVCLNDNHIQKTQNCNNPLLQTWKRLCH